MVSVQPVDAQPLNRQPLNTHPLPIPAFYQAEQVAQVWRVPYQTRAAQAQQWAAQYAIAPAAQDQLRTCLLLIDVQNTFCLPDFELYVGGKTGQGGVTDNQRLCEFIYRNLGSITEIVATLDTHSVSQIFHPSFWVNPAGEHPQPATMIHPSDVSEGRWQVNPAIAHSLQQPYLRLQAYAQHYVQQLAAADKYPLTVWPYHAMLGGVGHALVAAVEEACFFHGMVRQTQPRLELKGANPLTENYSVLSPEVRGDEQGRPIDQKNTGLIQALLNFDRVIVAGQAKSHCLAWTVADLRAEMTEPGQAQRVYLLSDCTSPVVIPGVVDFSESADAAFAGFAAAGMHLVESTMPLQTWPQFLPEIQTIP
jgi:nicotinamidase-related amidase